MIIKKRKNIFIDDENIIYQKNILTYEELCKIVKKKEKINIYILSTSIYFKILDYKDREKIYKFMENTFMGSENYLIHYENKLEKTYIYAVKSSEIVRNILNRYDMAIIRPIEFKMKDLLIKEGKQEENYKIKFMKKEFCLSICDNMLIINNITDKEGCIQGKMILNENKEKILIYG